LIIQPVLSLSLGVSPDCSGEYPGIKEDWFKRRNVYKHIILLVWWWREAADDIVFKKEEEEEEAGIVPQFSLPRPVPIIISFPFLNSLLSLYI
jgi:hypothetical protein